MGWQEILREGSTEVKDAKGRIWKPSFMHLMMSFAGVGGKVESCHLPCLTRGTLGSAGGSGQVQQNSLSSSWSSSPRIHPPATTIGQVVEIQRTGFQKARCGNNGEQHLRMKRKDAEFGGGGVPR